MLTIKNLLKKQIAKSMLFVKTITCIVVMSCGAICGECGGGKRLESSLYTKPLQKKPLQDAIQYTKCNTLDITVQVLKTDDTEKEKYATINDFLNTKKTGRSRVEWFIEILQAFDKKAISVEKRNGISKVFIEREENLGVEDFCKILKYLNMPKSNKTSTQKGEADNSIKNPDEINLNDNDISEIILIYVKAHQITQKELFVLLENVKYSMKEAKFKIIIAYMEKTEMDLGDLQKIADVFPFVFSETEFKERMSISFLRKNNPYFSIIEPFFGQINNKEETLIALLKCDKPDDKSFWNILKNRVGFSKDADRDAAYLAFYKSGIPGDFDRLKTFLKEIKNDSCKLEIIKFFFNNPKKNLITVNQLDELLRIAKFQENEKTQTIGCFLANSSLGKAVDFEILNHILQGITTDDNKVKLVKGWLENTKCNVIHFKEIISAVNLKNSKCQILLIESLLNNVAYVSPDEFIELMKQFNSASIEFRKKAISEFLFHYAISKKNSDFKEVNDTDYLLELFATAKFNAQENMGMVMRLLEHKAISCECLVKILKNDALMNIKHNVSDVIIIFKKTGLQPQKLQDFAKALYNNSTDSQYGFFKEAIDRQIISSANISENIFNKISDDDTVLQIIAYALKSDLVMLPESLIKMVKNRISHKYESIKGILRGKKIEDCVTKPGLNLLKGLFGSLDEITMSDIVSYYDVNDQLHELSKILNLDFKEKITSEFRSSNKTVLVSQSELRGFCQLVGNGNENSINSKFIKGSLLRSYFKDRPELIIPKLRLAEKDGFQITFDDNQKLFSEDKKKIINGNFRLLLSQGNPSSIENFFKSVCIGDISFDANEKIYLEYLWARSSDMVIYLLKQTGGIEELSKCIYTIKDGCDANIGTHIHTTLYTLLLKNKSDAILYNVFNNEIFYPIINSGIKDNLASVQNPLGNSIVDGYFISPEALLKKMCECFISNTGKVLIDSWEVIKEKTRIRDVKVEFMKDTKIEKAHPMRGKLRSLICASLGKHPYEASVIAADIDKKEAEVASYLILKGVVDSEKLDAMELKIKVLAESFLKAVKEF